MKWTTVADNRSLLLFSTFIVVAIAIAGGYSQSQKVTFIVGGSKNEMQRAFALAGVIGVVIVVGTILILSDKLAITGDNPPFALPQANLMSTLTSGITSGKLPWVMLIVGIVIALVMYFLKLPIMTIAIGFYLPVSTTMIILVGALLRVLVEKTSKSEEEKELKMSNGISLSSGLVAGGSIVGLIGIVLQISGIVGGEGPKGFAAGNGMALILLVILCGLTLLPIITSKVKKEK